MNDVERSGHPIRIITHGVIEEILEMMLNVRGFRMLEIVEAIGVSCDSVVSILNDQLCTRKLSASWVDEKMPRS